MLALSEEILSQLFRKLKLDSLDLIEVDTLSPLKEEVSQERASLKILNLSLSNLEKLDMDRLAKKLTALKWKAQDIANQVPSPSKVLNKDLNKVN